ncbi:hypothetical protein ACVIGB_003820 [Bradyrhizobium sp. USDA 4341]
MQCHVAWIAGAAGLMTIKSTRRPMTLFAAERVSVNPHLKIKHFQFSRPKPTI